MCTSKVIRELEKTEHAFIARNMKTLGAIESIIDKVKENDGFLNSEELYIIEMLLIEVEQTVLQNCCVLEDIDYEHLV